MKIIRKKPLKKTHPLSDVNSGAVIDLLDGSGLVLRTETCGLPNENLIIGVFIDTGQLYIVFGTSDLNREVEIISGSFIEE